MGLIHRMSYPPHRTSNVLPPSEGPRAGAIDGGTAEGGKLGRVGECARVATIGGGETRGDGVAGSGRSYGESVEEWGEMGRGGRWPDGEHRPIATPRPPNQSRSYGLLHMRLTYHLRGGQRAGRGRGARDGQRGVVGAVGQRGGRGPAAADYHLSEQHDPHHTGGRSTLLWAMTLDHE